jgi:hypothetical protein
MEPHITTELHINRFAGSFNNQNTLNGSGTLESFIGDCFKGDDLPALVGAIGDNQDFARLSSSRSCRASTVNPP